MAIEEKFLQAMERGDVVVVDRMLKSKEVTVNQKLKGRTVLVHGIDCGNPDIVACAIENGADVGTSDGWYGSLLHLSIRKYKPIISGRSEFLELHGEAKQRAIKVFHLILDAYKKLGSQKLMEGAFVVRDNDENSAFVEATLRGASDVVLILLDLINEETMEFLDVSHFHFGDGINPFHYVYCLNDEAMNALFDRLPFKDQLINKRNMDGLPPLNFLMFAMGRASDNHRYQYAAVLLLNNGANPNLLDRWGQTPLHIAIRNDCSSVCEVLFRAGCRTDIFDTGGMSALKTAISFFWRPAFRSVDPIIKIIKLLLVNGVDLDKEPYLYDDDELPVEYRSPQYEDRINTAVLDPVLLEKLRFLRRSGALESLEHRCRVAVLRSLKISVNNTETSEQCSGNDIAIDSLPLPQNLKSYLRADGDKVLAMLDS